MRPRSVLLLLALVAVLAAAVWWWQGSDSPPAENRSPAPSVTPTDQDPASGAGTSADLGAYEAAASQTREDSYYPETGNPIVDTLHHDLTLQWLPRPRRLLGHDTITFRATADADTFSLALSEDLAASTVTVDGEQVASRHEGIELTIEHPVSRGQVYEVAIEYDGHPRPVAAPTQRSDITGLGFTISPRGNVWTMQEPYGAYTWYPVNDQPADKALYDLTITAPAPLVGVSNGTLTSRRTKNGRTTTTWHNAEPMSSYLMTLGIGDYVHATDQTASGVPLNYWVLRHQRHLLPRLRKSKPTIEWIEKLLGPYPFESAGVLLTESDSGMETQTLLTLGDGDYPTSAPVLAHEFVHQWYGNLVGPTDWRDVWMNEGMTMYLQAVYEAEHGGSPLKATIANWRSSDHFLRTAEGPPGEYKPNAFGGSNIYLIPAVMWSDLRARVGDEAFWSMAREWPRQHAYSSATREQFFDWIERTTGEELTRFFEQWISGERAPD